MTTVGLCMHVLVAEKDKHITEDIITEDIIEDITEDVTEGVTEDVTDLLQPAAGVSADERT